MPAILTLSNGEVLKGSATTSLNGQYFVSNARLSCNGTYVGRQLLGIEYDFKRSAPVMVRCSDGKIGASQDALWETKGAQLRFGDGSIGKIVLGESTD